ncbi:hypothetical protein [Hyphomonas adhaerens]|uniref:hypothetical protein n=1 Tax=Hyphomonas adhaerens TaxID=81029 RepID=UPI002356A2C5|nr:hypothetical protein [Hyphomonas adhaerens]
MTEHMTTRPQTPPKKTRHRRTRAELDALRTLARAAALDGESLASLRARLQIPEATLTRWARLDGYRQIDIRAREETDAAARGEGADAIEAIRQQADELWRMCEEMQDRPTTGARRQVDLARARALALAEAGHLDAAEEEIAAVRRLARILSFSRAGTGEMEKFQNQAAIIVRQKGLERAMAYARQIKEEAEAEAAARKVAGLPPLPPPEPDPDSAAWSKADTDAFYEHLREKDRTRDYWAELVELRRQEREEGVGGAR